MGCIRSHNIVCVCPINETPRSRCPSYDRRPFRVRAPSTGLRNRRFFLLPIPTVCRSSVSSCPAIRLLLRRARRYSPPTHPRDRPQQTLHGLQRYCSRLDKCQRLIERKLVEMRTVRSLYGVGRRNNTSRRI